MRLSSPGLYRGLSSSAVFAPGYAVPDDRDDDGDGGKCAKGKGCPSDSFVHLSFVPYHVFCLLLCLCITNEIRAKRERGCTLIRSSLAD